MKAIVVFHGDGQTGNEQVEGMATHPLSPFLKAGFRHCFVCLLSGECWVKFDGAGGVPSVAAIADATFDLAGFFRRAGLTVIGTEQCASPQRTLFVMNNCVGLVKAALCIRAPFVWSPWQLYKHLLRSCP